MDLLSRTYIAPFDLPELDSNEFKSISHSWTYTTPQLHAVLGRKIDTFMDTLSNDEIEKKGGDHKVRLTHCRDVLFQGILEGSSCCSVGLPCVLHALLSVVKTNLLGSLLRY